MADSRRRWRWLRLQGRRSHGERRTLSDVFGDPFGANVTTPRVCE
jgi:hypothetical protein